MDEHTAHTPKDVDKIHLELLSTDDRDTAIRPAHPGEQPFGRLPDGGHTAKQGSDPDPNNVPMCQRYRVTSERFFDWLQQLGQLSNNAGDRKRFYFRGESRANYQLLPSLLRDGIFKSLSASHGARSPIELQQKLLDRYRRYTQHLIHSDNDFQAPISEDFDTLCLAQHHGLPTEVDPAR